MSSAGAVKKAVAVTGASGYLASWLVKLLLDRGYTVKASVRDLSDPRKTEFLMALDGAKERLQLFQANLLEEGSFDALVEGCQGVFHTASPVQVIVSNPQVELLDPAVKGTMNVLKSCAKVPSLRRVVLTSSMAAVVFKEGLKYGVTVDESWFSDPSYCEERKLWYPLSKILAENAARELSKEHGIDLIVTNPGWVIGPVLQASASFSVGCILNQVKGDEALPNLAIRWIDVRDVAYAHILAFEVPSASGRYCLVESSSHPSEAVKILNELFPTLQIPHRFADGGPLVQPKYDVSNEKAKGLGIQFIPLEVSLKDTIESFKEKNLIKLEA